MEKKKKMSKQDKVLNYLKNHKKGITQMTAIERFQAYRLSSIIYRLKQQGYNIVTNMEYHENQDGYICGYARYFLV